MQKRPAVYAKAILGGASAHRQTAARLGLLLGILASLTGCASLERIARATWPKPQIDFLHIGRLPSDQNEPAEVALWKRRGPTYYVNHATLTGSMRPYIHGGPNEWLLLERYNGRALTRADIGRVASFDRGDVPRCLHMIAAVSADGEYVYFTGTANARSDGWHHRSKLNGMLHRVVTTLEPETQPRLSARDPIAWSAGNK